MNPTKWLTSARAAREELVPLIRRYHPVYREMSYLPITAPAAEAACEVVRNQIKGAFTGDPLTQFEDALDKGDPDTVYTILSDTWFGVPESTDCWLLIGFNECVALLEDPPEYDDALTQ